MANQGKLCAITNNTAKDIVVAVAISDDETTSQDAVISANQQMEILKTSAGSIVIKNGSSDTVTLDHNYKPGADETGYVQDYNLIVSDSDWLYPLADLPVVQQGSNGSASYAPQTVNATNQAAMTQAVDFYQTITAYPSSQLAKDYMTTLQQTQDAALARADGTPGSAKAVADAIENAIDSFFKGTDQYKDVMLADIVAVDNYYNNFPCVWAQYNDSITYYLYGTDGVTAIFAGTLSLNKSGAVDITKPNGGYACSFTPAINPSDTSKTDVDTSKVMSLTYSGGLFLDDAGVSTPRIGLKGNFLLERLFTNDPDDNAVISVLTGTINGMTCIGFDIPQPSNISLQTNTQTAVASSSAEKYWNVLIHPKSQQDLIISILTLVGAILLIPATAFVIYGIYRIVKYKQQVKEPASKEIIESKRNALTDSQRESIERKWSQIGRSNDDISDDEDFNNVEGYNQVFQNYGKSIKLTEAFEMQQACLQKALKYSTLLDAGTIKLIQQSLRSVRDSINSLYTSKFKDLETVLPDAYTSFSGVQGNLKRINTAVNRQLTEEEKAMIEGNIIESTKIFDNLQNSTQKDEEEESDTNPDLEKKIIPEEFLV